MKMKKITVLKVLVSMIVLSAILLPVTGCNQSEDEEESEATQIASVQRGSLTVDITAAGNLALSQTEDLAIDLFYQKGTIEEVLVEAGDTVTAGQVMVKLDRDEWDDNVKILQEQLTAAERMVTTKERALTTAERLISTKERSLAAAESQVTVKELALQQSEINLQTAEYYLNNIEEVREVQEKIDEANYQLEHIEFMLIDAQSPGANANDYQYWVNEKSRVRGNLTEAQQEMNDILSGASLNIATTVAIEVANKQLAVETAQRNLDDATQAIMDAQVDVDDAELALEYARFDAKDAKVDVEDAKQDALDAREALDEALDTSPEIVAPFDGFITKVNVDGGDEVVNGTVAVQIADPNKFEADILVSEMDIIQLEIGDGAMVEVDALQGISLPATVTRIAPTATIQSGVVNYSVKVEIQSMEAIAEQAQDRRQQFMQDLASGEIPEIFQQAIDEGRMTEEQVREMMERWASGDFSPPEGFEPPEGFTPQEGMEFPSGMGNAFGQESTSSQVTLAVPENFQLREGLTVTVTIIIEERTDTLMVPNAAVSTEGLQSYVEVVTASGETEKRAVLTGISDWQFTEITDGLEEGEEVIVPEGTVVTTTEDRRGGFMMFGGPR